MCCGSSHRRSWRSHELICLGKTENGTCLRPSGKTSWMVPQRCCLRRRCPARRVHSAKRSLHLRTSLLWQTRSLLLSRSGWSRRGIHAWCNRKPQAAHSSGATAPQGTRHSTSPCRSAGGPGSTHGIAVVESAYVAAVPRCVRSGQTHRSAAASRAEVRHCDGGERTSFEFAGSFRDGGSCRKPCRCQHWRVSVTRVRRKPASRRGSRFVIAFRPGIAG